MPLTLPETLRAIQELDTEQDIIHEACQRFLGGESVAKEAHLIAKQILTIYQDRAPMDEVMVACCLVVGRLAGASAGPSNLEEVMSGLKTIIVEEMARTLLRRFGRDRDEC